MGRFLLVIFLYLFSLNISSKDFKPFVLRDYYTKFKTLANIDYAVEKYQKSRIVYWLREFVKASRPNRVVGTKGHISARSFLIEAIEKIDSEKKGLLTIDEFNPDLDSAIKMFEDDFKTKVVPKFKKSDLEYIKWEQFTQTMVNFLKSLKMIKGKNIIWEKKGYITPEEEIVVFANYDTLAHNKDTFAVVTDSAMPGADNNASGVASLLAMIEILSEINLPKTVKIVFMDFEEPGFLGTKAFVSKYKKELKKRSVIGAINLAMLGNDSKGRDKKKKLGNMKIYLRNDGGENPNLRDMKLVQRINTNVEKLNTRVTFEAIANNMDRGGHINFWNSGIPAIMFTQDWENDFNPRYHTSNDFIETLNTSTLHSSMLQITSGVLSWCFDIIK